MKLYHIKMIGINLAQHLLTYDPNSLQDKILWSYHHHLQQKFKNIFSSYRERTYLIEQLSKLLEDNWHLTKNTSLAYTCIPTHLVTQLMLGVAEFIAKETHAVSGIIHILMPGLELESISDDYPDLTLTKFQSVKAVTKILQTHILSDDSKYLIPIRLLANLVLNDMSNLINPYFNYERMTDTQAHINPEELQRLSSHSIMTQNFWSHLSIYRDVTNQQDHLLGQLRKLCLGLNMGSRYGEGSELHAGGSAYASIIEFNHFYNHLFSRKIYQCLEQPVDLSTFNQSYIWVNQRKLYYIHNNEPQKIELHNKESFKSTLNKLLGNDWEMGQLNPQDLYHLIEKHSDFKTIDPRISTYLQQEIRNLIDYATDTTLNSEATDTTQTCVASIRQVILIHISSQEELLASFKLSSNSTEDLEKIRQDARNEQQKLLESLDNDTYNTGHDSLENYGKLIRKLSIDFEISSLIQFKNLLNLNPKNFQSIFKFEDLRRETLFLFNNLDPLLDFMMKISAEKLRHFASIFKIELTSLFLSSISDWCYILAILDTERAAAIFNLSAGEILTKPENLSIIANHISLLTFQMICISQKKLILTLFDTKNFLELINEVKSPGLTSFWIDYFLSDFTAGFSSIELFTQLSPYLNPEQINIVFETNRIHLLEDIKNSKELNVLMKNCLKPHQLWLFAQIIEKLSSYATDMSTLQQIFKLAPEPYFKNLCERLSPNVETHLKKCKHLHRLLEILAPNNQVIFINHFEIFIIKLMLSADSVAPLMTYSDLLQKPLFYKGLYNQLISGCDTKSCCNFILSLALDESYIKRDFERLFSPRLSLAFFAKPIQPDQMINKILNFPEPEVKKLFFALALPWDNNKDIRKHNLKMYIQELQAQPSAQKRIKLTPA